MESALHKRVNLEEYIFFQFKPNAMSQMWKLHNSSHVVLKNVVCTYRVGEVRIGAFGSQVGFF